MIGIVIICLIALLPLGIQTNILNNIINNQMSNISYTSCNKRVENMGKYIKTVFDEVNNDMKVFNDYSEKIINKSLPINKYYKNYFAVSSIDGNIPINDNNGDSYFSGSYKVGINNLDQVNNIEYINETTIIDNIFRSIYKSNNRYDKLYIGMNNGLFRRYPYGNLDNYNSYKYICANDNLQRMGYDPRCRQWYVDSEINNSTINYSAPYVDASSSNVLITVSKSIIINNRIIGVIGIDLKMIEIDNTVMNFTIEKNGYNFMFDKTGLIISYPKINRNNGNQYIQNIEPSITNEIINSIILNNTGINDIVINKNNNTWIFTYIFINDNYILATVYPLYQLYDEANILNLSLYWIIMYGVIGIVIIFTVVILILIVVNIIIGQKYSSNIKKLSNFLVEINNVDKEMGDSLSSNEFNILKKNLRDLRTTICYGNTAFSEGHLDKALINYKSALVIFERTKNMKGLAMCYNNIANVHKQLNQNKEAIDLYNKSINYVEQLMNSCKNDKQKLIEYKIMLANRYMNLGVLHKDNNNFDLAMDFFNKSLSLNKESDNVSGIAKVNNNLGQLLLQKDSINQADELINITYDMISNRSDVDPLSLQYCIMSMGILEFYKGNYIKCIEFLCKILDTYQETSVYIQQTCLEYLDNAYTSLGSLDIAIQIRSFKKQNLFSKNIFFVLDTSGSMAGSPLNQCKNSIKDIITNYLALNDNISLTTFNTKVTDIFPLLNKENHLQHILNNIDTKVTANGNTSFYDAIHSTLSKLNGIGDNYLIALTDGDDNNSSISPKKLSSIIESTYLNMIIITAGSVSNENTIKQLCSSCKKKGGKGIHIKADSNNRHDISHAFNNVVKILTGQLNIESFSSI